MAIPRSSSSYKPASSFISSTGKTNIRMRRTLLTIKSNLLSIEGEGFAKPGPDSAKLAKRKMAKDAWVQGKWLDYKT